MRTYFLAISLSMSMLLGACAAPQMHVKPKPEPGSRADGIVTMSSNMSIYNGALPDWSVADAGARKRCRAWGFTDAGDFVGSQEHCRLYDRFGRCEITKTTRFYQCQS